MNVTQLNRFQSPSLMGIGNAERVHKIMIYEFTTESSHNFLKLPFSFKSSLSKLLAPPNFPTSCLQFVFLRNSILADCFSSLNYPINQAWHPIFWAHNSHLLFWRVQDHCGFGFQGCRIYGIMDHVPCSTPPQLSLLCYNNPCSNLLIRVIWLLSRSFSIARKTPAHTCSNNGLMGATYIALRPGRYHDNIFYYYLCFICLGY